MAIIIVFIAQTALQNFKDNTINSDVKCRWGRKILHLSTNVVVSRRNDGICQDGPTVMGHW